MKAQRKLAALKEWAHINCQLDDDVILDNIEDEVLREAVDSGFKRMRIADRQNRSLSVEMMQDQDEDSFTKDEQIPRSRWQGGEVTYVFHVSCRLKLERGAFLMIFRNSEKFSTFSSHLGIHCCRHQRKPQQH